MLKKLSIIAALVGVMALATGCAEEGEPTDMMEQEQEAPVNTEQPEEEPAQQ